MREHPLARSQRSLDDRARKPGRRAGRMASGPHLRLQSRGQVASRCGRRAADRRGQARAGAVVRQRKADDGQRLGSQRGNGQEQMNAEDNHIDG